MLREHRAPWTILILVSFVFLGFSLFVNLPVIYNGFLFAGQAIYDAMAQSIAFDGDGLQTISAPISEFPG